jgi:hypothetical protein
VGRYEKEITIVVCNAVIGLELLRIERKMSYANKDKLLVIWLNGH